VDRRVKAVVAQVPSLMNAETRRGIDPARWEAVGGFLLADRIARHTTSVVNTMPVVAPEGQPCVLPGADAFAFFEASKDSAPTWRNAITVEALEKVREFDPVSLIHMLAPTALLAIAAEHDSLVPLDAVRSAAARAGEPKRLVVLPIRHFDIYEDPWRARAVEEAVGWFRSHL
jgi:fermentation-respiration switch protein FrsA (DUF1100 family)